MSQKLSLRQSDLFVRLVLARNTDGEQFSEQDPIALGEPRNPVTTDAVVDKFRSLTGPALAMDQQVTIIKYGLSQATQSDINALLNILASDLRIFV